VKTSRAFDVDFPLKRVVFDLNALVETGFAPTPVVSQRYTTLLLLGTVLSGAGPSPDGVDNLLLQFVGLGLEFLTDLTEGSELISILQLVSHCHTLLVTHEDLL
jgi:hypothetical protein